MKYFNFIDKNLLRFKFRQPNDTHQVNLTNLNDYHLYLKENPGIDTSPLLLYGTVSTTERVSPRKSVK